jgi:transcriptional regulator with XRE-family HTH domain/tetratricopeptide (TPR) repeat protein
MSVTDVQPDAPLGERVAYYRRRLGLSQIELARIVGRSESWLSQVERGARSVDRLSVLTELANALGVSVTDLSPGAPAEDRPELPPSEESQYVDRIRQALIGHPALGVALGATSKGGTRTSLAKLREDAARVWELTHLARYRDVAVLLADVLPALEDAARTAEDDGRDMREALSQTYQAASAVLAALDEPEGAWLAADRAAFVAESAGRPALVLASQHRLALAFLITDRLDYARLVADRAVDAAASIVGEPEADPELLSVWGALHLVLAVVASRRGQRAAAREHLGAAEDAGKRVGVDRNDFHTEFGPTNVALHAVAVAVELGDAGEALDRAERIDSSGLSAERRARLLIDVARANAQLRRSAEAVAALSEAESLTPEQVRDHRFVRETVRDLLQLAGRRPAPELRALAQRIGVAP